MAKLSRLKLLSRLRFACIGLLACLAMGGAMELLFSGVDMQGLLDEQATRSLLFEQGNVRRSTRDRLKTGDIQITLHWHNRNDLDLWCQDPTGEEISFRHTRSSSWGELDFDMNAGGETFSADPVENIHWPRNSALQGHYRVYVNYFQRHGDPDPTAYEGTILAEGRTRTFSGQTFYGTGKHLVAEFDVTHAPLNLFGIHPGIVYAALVVGSWFGLTAAILALALIAAENLWYRRYYKKPILPSQAFPRAVGIAFGCAFASGFLAQIVFGVVTEHLNGLPVALLRLVGWTVCFGFMGLLHGRLVPNVSRRIAFLLMLVFGWLGGAVFLFSSFSGLEVAARLWMLSLFGAAIGALICLVWVEEELPVETITTFSLPPMRMQPYRMTLKSVEPVQTGRQDNRAAAGEKPVSFPHELPK